MYLLSISNPFLRLAISSATLGYMILTQMHCTAHSLVPSRIELKSRLVYLFIIPSRGSGLNAVSEVPLLLAPPAFCTCT